MASSVVGVRFPFENKSSSASASSASIDSVTCGVYLGDAGMFLLGTSSGALLVVSRSPEVELVCELQSLVSSPGSPVIGLCQSPQFVFALQQCGTLHAYHVSSDKLLSERLHPQKPSSSSSPKAVILQAVGEPLRMCLCGTSTSIAASPPSTNTNRLGEDGLLLAIAGRRSVVVLNSDTLSPVNVLHFASAASAVVDFTIAGLTAHGKYLVASTSRGLLNVWTTTSKAGAGGYSADSVASCQLAFKPLSSSPSPSTSTTRHRVLTNIIQLNSNTLVVLTNLHECGLAVDFSARECAVDNAQHPLLSTQAVDMHLAHECLYVLQRDGSVLVLNHYMIARTVHPAAAAAFSSSSSRLLVPGSSDGDVLLLLLESTATLFASNGAVMGSAALDGSSSSSTRRPLGMLVSPSPSRRTKQLAVMCQQVSPGVLQAASFPGLLLPQCTTRSTDAEASYTCLEQVEHQNGFYCLAGRRDGYLDVYSLCLPPLRAKSSSSNTAIPDGAAAAGVDLALHKSLALLPHRGGAVRMISLCPTKPLFCVVGGGGNADGEDDVVLVSLKDFSTVYRFVSGGGGGSVQQVRWMWPFLQVECGGGGGGRTFVWNVENGTLERTFMETNNSNGGPTAAAAAAAAVVEREYDLEALAREMNGLDSASLGQACAGVLSVLHKWHFSKEVDAIAQSVFGFTPQASQLPVWFVQRSTYSQCAVLAKSGDVCHARLPEFAARHMLQVCNMYYLLSQYEPNFHPLFTFYCVDFPPRRGSGGGGGDQDRMPEGLSLDCLVRLLACESSSSAAHVPIVIRLLVCQQLDRLGQKRRGFLFEESARRLLELRSSSKTTSSALAQHQQQLHQRKELSTLHPVAEEAAVDAELIKLLQHNSEYRELLLLLAVGCVAHMEELSPLAARLVTEGLVESITLTSAHGSSGGGIDKVLASELLGLGFVLFRPHICHISRLIRTLLHLLVTLSASSSSSTSNETGVDAVRHLLKRIALAHPVLSLRTIGNELLDVNQTTEFRQATTDLLVCFSRDEDAGVHVMLKYLVTVVEILMKTLDPHDAAFRRQCFPTSSALLQQLVKRFPMCAFHQTSQRFALGTQESAILVYDVRTATKFKVLDGTEGACCAVAFDSTGEKLASYSAQEHCVRIWTTHGGLLDSFLVRGTLLARHALNKLEATANNYGTKPPSVQHIIRTCRLSWPATHEVRLRREDSQVVGIKV